jgi:hypothetical protein
MLRPLVVCNRAANYSDDQANVPMVAHFDCLRDQTKPVAVDDWSWPFTALRGCTHKHPEYANPTPAMYDLGFRNDAFPTLADKNTNVGTKRGNRDATQANHAGDDRDAAEFCVCSGG